MDYPRRKPLRLHGYDYARNGAYFVTICTQDRLNLFGRVVCDDADANPIVGATPRGRPRVSCTPKLRSYNDADNMIEKWLFKIEEKFQNTTINKHIIMPNHIHFIISLMNTEDSRNVLSVPAGDHAGSPLHSMIDWFKTMTTNEYINGVKSGIYPSFNKKIWQRSYHDRIIRNEKEYQYIWQYIDENLLIWEKDCFYMQ